MEINLNDWLEEIARYAKENAILKAQVKAYEREKEQKEQVKND